jgi:hypothetical protein
MTYNLKPMRDWTCTLMCFLQLVLLHEQLQQFGRKHAQCTRDQIRTQGAPKINQSVK